MSGFIEGVDRDQVTLFPDRLEDWIDEDHLVRVVDLFVGQVIADAAHDPGPLSETIEDDHGAEARIRAKPSRAIKPSFDLHLYAERHTVENVFQRIKRFGRIGLRYEKTLTSFMGSVSSSQHAPG